MEEPAIPDQVPVRITATRLADGAVLSDRRWVYDQYGNMTMEIDYQFGLLEQGYDTYTYEYGPNGGARSAGHLSGDAGAHPPDRYGDL